MVRAKWAFIMKNTTDEMARKEAKECEIFQQLMAVEWASKVTKVARTVLAERSFAKRTELLTPEDLKKLNDHLIKTLAGLDLDNMESQNYRRVAEVALNRLGCYNKSRSGEVEAISLKNYMNRRTQLSDVDERLVGDLSDVEKHLLRSQDLMVVRGKRGRGVPVIISGDLKRPLEYLAHPKVRSNAKILEGNHHLFPNSALGCVRAYDSLTNLRAECSLKSPERITSVSLRKYTYTLTQILNLQDNELQWLCDHLGHTKKVHLSHYRQRSGFLERVEIGKIMMIQDNNLQNKFVDKKLSEIDLKEIVFPDKDDKEDGDDAVGDDMVAAPTFSISRDIGDIDDFANPSQPKKAKTTRIKWTDKEEEELHKYFQQHFDKKTTPGKVQVTKAIQASRRNEGELHRRMWHTIVKKISAMNQKQR